MPSNTKEVINHLIALLAQEKEADYLQYQEKITKLSIAERVKSGVTLYPLTKINQFISTGERTTLKMEKSFIDSSRRNSQFQVGSIVNVFKIEGSKELHTSGVISFSNSKGINVVLHKNEAPDWLEEGKLGINMLFDEFTYLEMERTMMKVRDADNNRIAELREIFYGNQPARFKNGHELKVPSLNASQNKALSHTLNAIDLSIIHGPPGTGKTTTLIQCIKSVVAEEKQVLVCAPSNAAVDLLVEKLIDHHVAVIRLGHPARLTAAVIENSLDVQISKHAQFKELKRVRRKSEELRSMAFQYKRNYGRQEKQQRAMILRESKSLKNYSRDIENYIIDHLLQTSQVIACTVTGANQSYLKDLQFKTVFIDECSQSLEPACWIPIIKSQRVVMAGDHAQLPPTVKSFEAARAGLEVSLFEKAINNVSADVMLTTQYRMAEVIKGFSSSYFYDDALETAEEILNRENEGALEFIDTAGCGFEEEVDKTSLSTFNLEEAQLLTKHLKDHLPEQGTPIGIIAPYKAQINLLNDLILKEPVFGPFMDQLKVNTVDAFQGQERAIIYISMVRSNEKGEIGFLKEYRRMNVAMTRAKYKLVIIGDSSTLGNDPFYEKMLTYIENKATYKSAFEYM